ncbi:MULTISPECIES: hypothetical protein [Chroococcidiopsis]|jgi:hypothetical protein|uniref:Uncharacterized protein n=1 Tax=Chroococcidiopsis thermalis (strain PCC 7203) TaxID=251229 RepID=K9U3Z7_CHRTP|nr:MULTISPECIES: hypothetical protein [Chroococcidiopsis]AFY88969.1 hypothetical protein Chro_3512 [Chroococcidiopsis thermalis PCC 7203]MBE9019649.1 hypothetical protein [Chroococcidiopsidales cyanobacterium LEGE 13417]PSB45978.1 hypothetical protein C7B80_14950 [Cyanosarcina cf. burmensis CCALA 770]PSM47593.1 hypothetical protein C7Y66_18930 [Chroococcidiopsis sp. CCALA 051]
MSKTLVNLTHQALIAEVEAVLDNYPYYPHCQAFANPDLRQELIAYVLSRIPCAFSAVDDRDLTFLTYRLPGDRAEYRIQIENLIHQGICCVLQDKADWVSCHIPEPYQCGVEPSHWFG